jgi:PAS domain S-box-containing protein
MPQIWHNPHLMYLASLGSDIILLVCFGVGFPWALTKIFEGISYLDDLTKVKWCMIGACWALGFLVGVDLINNLMGNMLPSDIWIKSASAVAMMILCLIVHLKWPWLNTLYPRETLLAEQKRNRELIMKMRIWDDTTPCAKFESRSGCVTDMNLAAMLLIGYSRSELIGKVGRQLIHPEDRHYFEEIILQKKTGAYEMRILHKTGRVIPVEVHSVQAPYDPELRLSFLTDMTRYVEERDRRIREERAIRSHQSFTAGAKDLINTAGLL